MENEIQFETIYCVFWEIQDEFHLDLIYRSNHCIISDTEIQGVVKDMYETSREMYTRIEKKRQC